MKLLGNRIIINIFVQSSLNQKILLFIEAFAKLLPEQNNIITAGITMRITIRSRTERKTKLCYSYIIVYTIIYYNFK